ncbi:MAG: YlbF family regulator [Clostridia bacterium]|nr:YlbF family regulator [Clostridia bacterium]
MDIIKLTRELGAAIQQDERYIRFTQARQANESDAELNELMGQIQMIQMNYQMEASKETPDSAKMKEYEESFNEAYTKFMDNEKMQAYDAARTEVDAMMNYIMQILGLCVNGADPATCEPEEEHHHDCGGSCSSCSGCH